MRGCIGCSSAAWNLKRLDLGSQMFIDPTRLWYGRHFLSILLAPLSWLFCAVAVGRRWAYRQGLLRSEALPVPVIVVGNITVGGTGKTPLVCWLTGFLRRQGFAPGILTRGYGGSGTNRPILVTPRSDPIQVGDEPVLLARRGGCPVAVGPDRLAAGRLLLDRHRCDIIVTDDGLQHYRLRRDLEIAVVDGERGLGNGRCLPAGPLREPARRLSSVGLVVYNGRGPEDARVMHLRPGRLVNLVHVGRREALAAFRGRRVTAVAGIGNPDRFFALLRGEGLDLDTRTYGDHHAFSAGDAAQWGAGPVLMTEKDAVKCAPFAGPEFWFLPVDADPDCGVCECLMQFIRGLDNG